MKKSIFIASALLIILTTISTNPKTSFSKFKLKKIYIENNFLVKEEEVKDLLETLYDKNIFLINNYEIKSALMKNSIIDGFNVKKQYPNKLKIKIFEKKPIAILFDEKKIFYLSEKLEIIKSEDLQEYKNLPSIYGTKNEFKILYNELKKINFPFNKVKNFKMYENKRWDLITNDDITIKLPLQDYIKSLENYLSLENKIGFKNYNLFDYRISGQLILK